MIQQFIKFFFKKILVIDSHMLECRMGKINDKDLRFEVLTMVTVFWLWLCSVADTDVEESSFSMNILFYWETLYKRLPYRWEDNIKISKAFMAMEVGTLSQLCQVVEGLKIFILLDWLSLAFVWPGCIRLLHTVRFQKLDLLVITCEENVYLVINTDPFSKHMF